MESTLDICIPTFNRSASLQVTLDGLQWVKKHRNVRVIVLDNYSPDNTVGLVQAHFDWVQLEVNERNVGLGMNVLRCFSESRADFTMVLSDEDDLDEHATLSALSFAVNKEVDFLSPLALNREKTWYVRGSRSRRVTKDEVMDCSFLLSGLIFRTESAKAAINRYYNRFKENQIWQIYPQSALALHAIVHGKAWFFGKVTVRERDRNIGEHELGVNHYDTVNSRHAEFKALIELTLAMCGESLRNEKFCLAVGRSLAQRHLNVLANSISQEYELFASNVFQSAVWKLKLTFRRLVPQSIGMIAKRVWRT